MALVNLPVSPPTLKKRCVNAATIERNEVFWFYRDMTEQVARFIEKFDAERLAVGKAYGIDLLGVNEWIKFAYNLHIKTL